MDFIDYNNALEQFYDGIFWHLAPPDEGYNFFRHNLFLAKGFMPSISYAIDLDPNMKGAASPYFIFNVEMAKEGIFEKVESRNFLIFHQG